MDYFTKWAEALKNMIHMKANGQAESSNKTLLKLVKEKIEELQKKWHEVFSEVFWAHRISKYGATKVTPFELVYGQKAVLPFELFFYKTHLDLAFWLDRGGWRLHITARRLGAAIMLVDLSQKVAITIFGDSILPQGV
uniref:Retrotransposon protein, putative, unclassified n=1 Tax=Oryza sativa subsp. japonica TaxID=39947 RepID=Q2QSN7_ORYSJ|nr:retrotransposon protein, putative, unclassified [Oryza sativa Japonica Group]